MHIIIIFMIIWYN